MEYWKEKKEQFTLQKVASEVEKYCLGSVDLAHLVKEDKFLVDGVDAVKEFEAMMRPAERTGPRVHNTDVDEGEEESGSSGGGYRGRGRGTARGANGDRGRGKGGERKRCTNPHCKAPHTHSTKYCAAYGGAMEGQYPSKWKEEFKKSMAAELKKKRDELGPSGVVVQNSEAAEEPST